MLQVKQAKTRAGQFRHYVTLQGQSQTVDGVGQPVLTWTNVSSFHAEIMDLSGRELIAAQGVQAEVTTEINIRYRTDVLANQRIVFGAVIYNIHAVINPDGSGRLLTLSCQRELNQG